LSLVEQQLEFGGDDADTSDLQQLKSDLSELISLTQGEKTSGMNFNLSGCPHVAVLASYPLNVHGKSA